MLRDPTTTNAMTFWTYQNLADVTQGRWLVEPDDLSAQVAGLWHDTRDIKSGQAYLAIAGDNFDGHDFIEQAHAAGAALVIVSKTPTPHTQHPIPTIYVPDTVKALQDLARAYREVLKEGGCKVIGIAGSNGKTTTRHLIHHVLTHAGLKGTQSPKSFNNYLGVPLTLLSAKPQDDFVACEIGTNHPGEIDFLSAIARPDIAVITSIGEEHLEFFKDLEGVTKEEASILPSIMDGGIALIHDEAWELIENLSITFSMPSIEVFGYGHSGPGIRIESKTTEIRGSYVVRFLRDESEGFLQLQGQYNLLNATAAIGVGLFMGIDLPTIVRQLESATAPDSRGVVHHFGSNVTVIDDAYNANPASMRAALGMLFHSAVDEQRRVAILGDMFELGEASSSAHEAIATYAATALIGPVLLIGDAFSRVQIEPDFSHMADAFIWSDDLPEKVAALLEPGDTVLLKASRGMRLERLIPAIEARFGKAAEGDCK